MFINEPPQCKNLSLKFSTRSDTNWAVQPQKMARGMKLQIYLASRWIVVSVLRENKGTDQLCRYRAADLHLPGFAYNLAIMHKAGFLMMWLK